jgi:uncharacterized protein YdcH (DUF465 family)
MPEDRDVERVLEKLRAEHHELEMRLAELERHISLTPAEQVERIQLKKLKLAKKDAMARLSRQGQGQGQGATNATA